MAPSARPYRWIRNGLAVTAAALLVACGSAGSSSNSSTKSSPSPSPSPIITGTIDACTLVKATDASTVLGATMTSATSTSGTGLCVYVDQTGATTDSVLIYAQAYPDTTTADAVSPDQMAAVMNGQFGITNAKSVAGIGRKAFEYTATSSSGSGSGIVIFVFQANVVMFIAVSPTTDATKVEALARIAVGNLPQS